MKENKIPEKTLFLWQIRIGVLGAIPTAALFILSSVSLWFLIPAGVLTVFILLFLFWYLPRYFDSYEILFPKGAIIMNRGVFIKTSHIMPFSRLVYAQSFSTPLAKVMGLAAVSLKAARSSVIIPEFSVKDVNYFIDYLAKEADG